MQNHLNTTLPVSETKKSKKSKKRENLDIMNYWIINNSNSKANENR